MHAELERRLGFCGNLPSLPAVALRIIELANNPDVDLDDLAQVIAMDPALVTKLFRAANSPLYGLRRKATNLRQALNLLGLQGTLTLALGFSLIASSDSTSGAPLNTEQFWRRSLLAATACRVLGQRLALKNLEELFLAGLLHGIGILALAIMMPDQYAVLLDEAGDHQPDGTTALDCERLATLERDRLEVDHAEVGAWLLHRWGLPDYLCQAVSGSLDPDNSAVAEPYRKLVECVALSIHLADIWVRPGYWQHSPQIGELAQHWFNLTADDYVEIMKAVGEKFPEIADLFHIKMLDPAEVTGILDQAREILTIHNVRNIPLTLGRRPSKDAAARFALDAPPNSLPVTATDPAKSATPHATPALRRQDKYAFDALTGLFNRQQMEEILCRKLASAKSQHWPLSVALLACDDWSRISETYKRTVGDQVLIALGQLFGNNIRRDDVVARYSNETFALLLPASGIESTRRLLERLQKLIRQWKPILEGERSFQVSVSVGLATYPDAGLTSDTSVEELLQAAEGALRAAQQAGGDRLAVCNE